MCVCTPAQGAAPAIEGISMSQDWEWVPGRAARQLSVFHRLDLSVGRQPCLHTPWLSANLYRVDFTDRVIGALEAEGRGGEGGLWQKDKWGCWEERVMAMTVRSGVERKSWFGYGDYGDAQGQMKPAVCLQVSLQAAEATCIDTQWSIHSCANTSVRTRPCLSF